MTVLAPLDKENLRSQGLLSRPSEHGTRRINKRRLHQSSDEEYSDISLSPDSLLSDDSSSTIPENMLSLATIKYVGFDDEKADSIWRAWLTWTPDGRVQETENSQDCDITFLEHLISSVIMHEPYDVFDEDDQQWRNLMQRMGIDQRTQNAIMDPFFKVCRLTGSCVEWVKETVESRYGTLEMIQAASRERDMQLQRQRLRQGPGPQSSSSAPPGQRTTSGALRSQIRGLSSNTAMSDEARRLAENTPGFTTLFRGVQGNLLRDLYAADGSLNMGHLASHFPSDFCALEGAFYFAVDREVALKYAQWAKRRTEDSTAALLQIKLANSAIATLPPDQITRVYWDPQGSNNDWNEIIFYCRRKQRLPRKFADFKRAMLKIGTIAGKANKFYSRLKSPDHITERAVLKNQDSRPAVQYVFCHDSGWEFLETHCAGNLEAFPLTSSELRQELLAAGLDPDEDEDLDEDQ